MKVIIVIILFSSNLYSQYCANSITATIPYQSQNASGEYTIYPRQGGTANINNLSKPIIIVEGFDALNEFSCNNVYSLLNRYPDYLASQLHSQGYDIIVLNFSDGGDYIQRNSFLLMELINQVNNSKLDPNEELVVIGYSMGGLVARYCLTYMEENSINHSTRLFIAYDSPHKGANIPLSLQSMLAGFRSNLGIYSLLIPEVQSRYEEVMSPAAQQMLIHHTESTSGNPGSANNTPLFNQFYNELQNLNECNGYPQQCRSIGISLGNGNGDALKKDDNSFILPGSVAFDFFWSYQQGNWVGVGQSGYVTVVPSRLWPGCPPTYPNSSFLNQLNGAVNSFIALNSNSQHPIDIVPGSYLPVFKDVHDGLLSTIDVGNFSSNLNVKKATMIPTISALDLSVTDYFHDIINDTNIEDKTPFEDIFHLGSSRTSHITPARNNTEIQFIMNQINNFSEPECYELSENVSLSNQNIANNQIHYTVYKGIISANNFTISSGGIAEFEASNRIKLNPGFRANSGSSFKASIICATKSCTQ